MCRMAGFSFDDNQNISEIFEFVKSMALNGMEAPHNDGWGCFCKNDVNHILYKSLRPIYEDSYNINKITEEKFKLGLIHARLASKGLPKTTLQLHPFYINGRYFAHNGTIKSARRENIYESDTYEYFENIVNFNSIGQLVQNILKYSKINEFSGMNFIMVDEKENALYVCCLYTDTSRNKEYFTLHYYYNKSDKKFIVYSEKFSDEFQPMKNGEIIKVIDGIIVEKFFVNI
ncbi:MULTISPECIES: class II glutamine amidotransferase [Fervidobacterium]|uniref:Glutamine amidotransferase-like protein n=1 Tax=Fervidobacterium nodosum (strain ATCC 35602 / DSM 5306 / Rt17-B1) TaxID=381764 RepID=A7HJF5_FERNB|nr:MULTISPECIES: hypothetical protein [Fervidobacterium]ABS60038.1 glutamine amidotransferase-like protein [Fervidobacterium nodosum Rt17-B1]KAF2961245.1 glutamine amidotransferase [Fervidobacterium sp. 2310opik-2]HOJ93797.1 hypothetical protein [Fervidobacterium nodosum]